MLQQRGVGVGTKALTFHDKKSIDSRLTALSWYRAVNCPAEVKHRGYGLGICQDVARDEGWPRCYGVAAQTQGEGGSGQCPAFWLAGGTAPRLGRPSPSLSVIEVLCRGWDWANHHSIIIQRTFALQRYGKMA